MFMRINFHFRYRLTIFFFFRLTIICCGHGVNIPVNIFPFSDSVTASCGGQEIRGEKRIEVLAGFQFRF